MALRACGFIIFRRLPPENMEFLLLQTSYGEHHWTPPKGHVDLGEDDLTTALRETQEESGLGADQISVVDGFLQTLRYEVGGRPKDVLYLLAEVCDPHAAVTLSSEHRDFTWARLDRACALVRYSDLQETLRRAQEFVLKRKD